MKRFFLFVAVFFTSLSPFIVEATVSKVATESISVHLQDNGDFVVVDDISLHSLSDNNGPFVKYLHDDIGVISDISISTLDGTAIPFDYKDQLLHIYNSSPDIHIRYIVSQGIDFYKDYDQVHASFAHELRPYGIEQFNVAIHFPEGKIVNQSFLEQSIISPALATKSRYEDMVAHFEANDLLPFQSFSVIMQWPRNIIQAPLGESLHAKYFYIFLLVSTPLITLLLVAYTVLQHRKIHHFHHDDSPSNSEHLSVSPALAHYVYKENYSSRSLPAEIFELIALGYIRVHARFEKGVFRSSYVYKFEQVHVNYHKLTTYQKMIMELFFQKSRLVTFSDAAQYKKQLHEIMEAMISSTAREEDYIVRDKKKMHLQYISYLAVFATLLLIISFLIPLATQGRILAVESVLLFLIGSLMCLHIPTKTIKGLLLSKELVSILTYFKSRALTSLNGDHMTQMLAAAIILKQEKQWIADFSHAHELKLRWYAGKDEAMPGAIDQLVELFS